MGCEGFGSDLSLEIVESWPVSAAGFSQTNEFKVRTKSVQRVRVQDQGRAVLLEDKQLPPPELNMCVSGTLDLIKDPGVTGVWVPVGPPEWLAGCPLDDEPRGPDKLRSEVNDTVGEAPRMNRTIPVNPNVLFIAVGEDGLDNNAVVGSVNAWGYRSVNDAGG